MKRTIGITMLSMFLFSLAFTLSSSTVAGGIPPSNCGECCTYQACGQTAYGVIVCDEAFPGIWRSWCTCSASPAENPNDCPLLCPDCPT